MKLLCNRNRFHNNICHSFFTCSHSRGQSPGEKSGKQGSICMIAGRSGHGNEQANDGDQTASSFATILPSCPAAPSGSKAHALGSNLGRALEDLLLQEFHTAAGAILSVFVAGEVEKAVDAVEQQLAVEGIAVFRRLPGGGVDTDDDLAMLERDHIGGARHIHETNMQISDGWVIDERHLDFV